ncbi:hypothetical protein D3C81_1572130 [compost metagenome]
MAVRVVLTDQRRQLLALAWHLETLVDGFDQLEPALLMSDVSRPFLLRGKPFAQIVQQASPAHAQGVLMLCGLCEDREGVDATVDFRVVGRRLRYAEQGVEFRHQLFESATIA